MIKNTNCKTTRLTGLIVTGTLMLMVSTSSSAAPYQLGNCGSTWAQRLGLKDSYGNANFGPACVAHDKCYETCGKNRRTCDNTFKTMMRQACKRAYNSKWHVIQRRACLEIANTYHSAVNRNGGDAYRKAKDNCKIETIKVVSRNHKMCLNLQAHQNFDGGNTNVWTCAAHPDQSWRIEGLGGDYVRVINKHHNKCLNLQLHQNFNAGEPNVWTCTNHPDQAWKMVSLGGDEYRFINKAHGKCLNMQKHQKHDGGSVSVYDCHDHPDQRWVLNSTGKVSGKILCEPGYKEFYGRCKRIRCKGKWVVGEHRRESIRNGTKWHYCTNNGTKTVILCKIGFQSDGIGCYEFLP